MMRRRSTFDYCHAFQANAATSRSAILRRALVVAISLMFMILRFWLLISTPACWARCRWHHFAFILQLAAPVRMRADDWPLIHFSFTRIPLKFSGRSMAVFRAFR